MEIERIETKEDALLHCFDLWIWLAANPDKEKRHWPGWKTNGGYLIWCTNDCPCCEYMNVINTLCSQCPLKWTTGYCDEYQKGEFYHWDNAETKKDRTKYALKIAQMALKEYFKD